MRISFGIRPSQVVDLNSPAESPAEKLRPLGLELD
jgi:hypothetical protein